ncbi:MAG: alanine--tRNA ligase, partial [Gammaproteobacteria bacterium]|nr:alanine--tRNA ligase [Gammaproteobacteria bacterium]
GRGFVLRRIIRRAIRHGHKLGMRQPFFHQLVAPLEKEMGDAYPELRQAQAHVERLLLQEEMRFAETLDLGMQHLEQELLTLKEKTIPGPLLFKLYDTFGFPVDLTADIARERGLKTDLPAFEQEMEQQRQRARSASQFAVDSDGLEINQSTPFVGYEALTRDSSVIALFHHREAVAHLQAGEDGIIVLDSTPFYAESGGQKGDRGTIRFAEGEFVVEDVQKHDNAILHHGRMISGSLTAGATVTATVDPLLRQRTAIHHSATHLLHAALRQLVGAHVQQKGSLVGPERLRFDFSHYDEVDNETLRRVEQLVNDQIRANDRVETEVMEIEAAKKSGAMALFGEKYGEKVRVLRMGQFSVELCGGTHTRQTGDIGLFKITSEGGVAAGVRRIEAVCGNEALQWVQEEEQILRQLGQLLRGGGSTVTAKVEKLLAHTRTLERELEQMKSTLASAKGSDLASSAIDIDGIQLLTARLDGADPKGLRETVDQLKNKLKRAIILLAAVNEGKIALVAGVTKAECSQVKAGDLLQRVATAVGGKGGGRPDMAQGGGSQPENLDPALTAVEAWVRQKIQGDKQ